MTSFVYSTAEIKDILLPIFIRYDVKKAILFGSYGKEKATSKSDIDLFVDSGLRGLGFIGLSEDVRNALDKEIDIFDTTHIIPKSQIEQEIHRTGVVIYEK